MNEQRVQGKGQKAQGTGQRTEVRSQGSDDRGRMTERFDFGIRTGRRAMLRDDAPASMGLQESACESTDKERKKGKRKFSVVQLYPVDADNGLQST